MAKATQVVRGPTTTLIKMDLEKVGDWIVSESGDGFVVIFDRPMARTRIQCYPTHKNMGKVPVMCVSGGLLINIEISGPESEA